MIAAKNETTGTTETTETTKTNGTTETELSQMSRSRMSCMSRVSRLREGWKTVKLGEISVDGGHYGIGAPAVEYDERLPTYLRITDIRDDGSICKEGLKSVDSEDAEEYYLKPNDLVIARTGASTGRNYFYDGRDGDFVYAGFLIKFSIDENKIWPPYVKYWFKGDEYRSWLNNHTDGSTRANINAVTLAECPIRVPKSLPTQRKIAAVLGALDDKIENNRKICANLEAQAQALFKSWFVDFEPWGGKMPKDWKMGKLGDVCCVSRNTITPEEMPEIVEHYSLPAFDKNRLPSYEQSTTIKSNKFRVSKGSILISKLNPKIKRLWDPFVETECAISSTEFVVIEPKEEKVREFVYSVLDSKSFESYASSHAAGTTNSHQRISPEDILRYEIVLPTAEMLSRFSGFGKGLLAKRKELLKQSRSLAELRDALLPKLMSGELDVSEVAV